MKKTDTHCFVAGQSGGHIIPCITLAQEVLAKHPNDRILFFTTTAPLDQQLTQNLGKQFTIVRLPISSIKSLNPLKLLRFGINLITAFFMCAYHLIRTPRPQSITSTGGICTIPATLVGYLLRIPTDLYELNVLPGRTTYFLASFARTIYCCFARTIDFLPQNKCKKTGYPIRFFNEEQHSRNESCTLLNLDPDKKTVLILGGSQGSVLINTMIKQWITETDTILPLQIIHQTGAFDPTDWQALYKKQGIQAIVFAFDNNMEHYYAAADLIICRSGAGTLFEVLYFHKQCITIPLELQANAHQIHNAFTIAQEYPELFQVLTQDILTQDPQLLTHAITQVWNHAPLIKKHTPTQSTPDHVTTI